MAEKTPRKRDPDSPIDISTDPEKNASDSDFEAELLNRACDREEAQVAAERAVADAQERLTKFKKQAQREADLDRMARALKKRQKMVDETGKAARKELTKAAEEPSFKDRKGKEKYTVDELFASDCRKIAKRIIEMMVADGVYDGPSIDALDTDDPPPVNHAISREEELIEKCVPEQLRSDGFETVELSFPTLNAPAEGSGDLGEFANAIHAMYAGLRAINVKVDHLVKVQQVHTLAHLSNLRATALLRQLCLKDGLAKDKVYTNLQLSMKSVILGSDADLRGLPFRAISTIEVFFKDFNRLVKLGHFLLVFVDYGRRYTVNLLDTMFHIELQRSIFWKSGTGDNGCVCNAFDSASARTVII